MSTQPTPKPSISAPLYNRLETLTVGRLNAGLLWASHYFKAHESLIIVVIAVALAWGVSGKVQDVITAHDKKQFDAAQSARQAQANANAAAAIESKKLADNYQTMARDVLAQNVQLEQTNAKLTTALARQKATDATLPAPALASRIESLAALPANSVQPQPGNVFSVSNNGAVLLAQALESLPVLQKELANVQQEKTSDDALIAAHPAVVASLNKQIDGLKAELVTADKACKAEIKVIKDEAAKGKRRFFVAGYIAGLATRGIVKILGGV